ncbi:unnamed protein product [Nippostrongylus brasiliensis]|uniref:non-specific serine/threonine protein kinase n=1 Tax=Nippostrongylus brasiliensis TaxID=27835 RepID=A0A158R2L0_NIPBR|nr:unnamed protein product [Nippostrongylus brasiliensis]
MNIEKLREMIGGKFRPGSAFYIAGEVLNALGELHGHGFVHRDVKPTNICVGVGGQSSRIYLIDFGDTVRTGKKIKYGVPDSYSLPYWSIGNHRRNAATEKNDIEGWFYTLLDLYDSSLLSWKGELNEPDVEKAKTEFWGDYQNNIGQSSQALLSIADLINSAEDSIDEAKLKRYVRAGFEQLVKNPKKFAPEWVRGTVTQTAIAGAKTKRLSVQT